MLNTIDGLRETYLAKKKKMEEEVPYAHFEVVTSVAHSILAPSKKLLIDAGIFKKSDGTKNPKMPFKEYAKRFKEEIINNKKALDKLRALYFRSKERIVYLICYERDASQCHRTLLIEIANDFKRCFECREWHLYPKNCSHEYCNT